MGWCSATSIMDAAISAADALVASVRKQTEPQVFDRDAVDEVLRPFVAAIAEGLRDGDWDCIEDARDFARFRQEMLGCDDGEMVAWYREKLSNDHYLSDIDAAEYATALVALLKRAAS